jgi:beta-lactamase class A
MKIWLGVALLDAVDRGEVRLDEVVTITPPDLSVFNQPMTRPVVMKTGSQQASLERLLSWSIAKSDNAATDILMRRVGGGPAAQAVLDRKGVRGVRVGLEERVLQPKISGLEWRPEYIDNDLFERDRDRAPDAVREAALARYLRDPIDGATPLGTVNALEALARASCCRRIHAAAADHHVRKPGGRGRLGPGCPSGVAGEAAALALVAQDGHGPGLGRVTAGFNDVGVLVAPDGRAYAVAVYIGPDERPVPERQKLIADVSRAVVAHLGVGRSPPGRSSRAARRRPRAAAAARAARTTAAP